MFRLPVKAANRRGSITVIVALALLPIALIVGLAIDYSIYSQARAQADLAVDAAAMHAVHAASVAYGTGATTDAALQAAGVTAGQAWFSAQLGASAHGSATSVTTVTYTAAPSTFTALVTYTGTVSVPLLGSLVSSSWPISGSATAVISNAYVEVLMLLDNSSSMLIGATTADIQALEQATPCSKLGAAEVQPMYKEYSWNFSSPSYSYGPNSVLVPVTSNGICDPRYTGVAACPYPATFPSISRTNAVQCTNGGGWSPKYNNVTYANMPGAPCAFACHSSSVNNDYYGLARSLTNPAVTLRLDVVQKAAAQVVTTLSSEQTAPGQFLVGIYEFNTVLQSVYPAAGAGVEAGSDLPTALAAIQNASPPVTPIVAPNTYLQPVANLLAANVTTAGDGSAPSAPRKNLFIVTDGLDDHQSSTRIISPMTTATNNLCTQFWDKGFNVFVLYTPYLPLPQPFYFTAVMPYSEGAPTSQILAGLQACARYSSNFFQASDPSAIYAAMNAMLTQALNSSTRVQN